MDWMWQEKEKEKSRLTLDVFSLSIQKDEFTMDSSGKNYGRNQYGVEKEVFAWVYELFEV